MQTTLSRPQRLGCIPCLRERNATEIEVDRAQKAAKLWWGAHERCNRELYITKQMISAIETNFIEEPWRRFQQYVEIPKDVPESRLLSGCYLIFMFKSEVEANRIPSILPPELAATLCNRWKIDSQKEQKYRVFCDSVKLSIAQGKKLMNLVVSEGGEIYSVSFAPAWFEKSWDGKIK